MSILLFADQITESLSRIWHGLFCQLALLSNPKQRKDYQFGEKWLDELMTIQRFCTWNTNANWSPPSPKNNYGIILKTAKEIEREKRYIIFVKQEIWLCDVLNRNIVFAQTTSRNKHKETKQNKISRRKPRTVIQFR